MAEEIAGSALEIKEIAEKAFQLQRHLLRRAWGVLYATYSVSIFLTVFSSALAFALGLAGQYKLAEHVAVDILASGAALTMTLREFRRINGTAEIRSLVFDGGWTRVLRYRVLVPTWVAANAVILVSMVLFSDRVGLLVLLIYSGFWGLLYYALRLSFPGRLPREGIAALASLGVAVVGSILLILSVSVSAEVIKFYGLLWGGTVLVWAASAVYARTRALSGVLESEAR